MDYMCEVNFEFTVLIIPTWNCCPYYVNLIIEYMKEPKCPIESHDWKKDQFGLKNAGVIKQRNLKIPIS